MSIRDLASNLKELTVGLDDTFQFHCTKCGKCCIHRNDIILSPMDIFKMSKELKMEPQEFIKQYCTSHIGDTSRFPVVCLKPVGKEMRCPLLKGKKCLVHNVKPSVCALFPLGRYVEVNKNDDNNAAEEEPKVQYLLQPIDCGNTSKTYTVREWLSNFDIDLEDKCFILWQKTIIEVSTILQEIEPKVSLNIMEKAWLAILVSAYCHYSTDGEFLPQFEDNIEKLLHLASGMTAIIAKFEAAED